MRKYYNIYNISIFVISRRVNIKLNEEDINIISNIYIRECQRIRKTRNNQIKQKKSR